MGLSPLCTVGAAEFEPPASGRTALFSIAMEFDVFSLALPVVAEGEVVQLVSCFWPDGAVDCAAAGPTINDARKTTAATRPTMFTPERKLFPKWNVLPTRWFHLAFRGQGLESPIALAAPSQFSLGRRVRSSVSVRHRCNWRRCRWRANGAGSRYRMGNAVGAVRCVRARLGTMPVVSPNDQDGSYCEVPRR